MQGIVGPASGDVYYSESLDLTLGQAPRREVVVNLFSSNTNRDTE